MPPSWTIGTHRGPTGRSALSIVGLLGFGTVVLLAMLLLHSYLWWRMVRSTTVPGRTRRRLTRLTVALALLPVLAILLRRTLPLEVAAPLDWVAYSWLGIAFYAFLALLALELIRLVAAVAAGAGRAGCVPVGRRARGARRGSGPLDERGWEPEPTEVVRVGPGGLPRRMTQRLSVTRERLLAAVRSGRIAMS